jgi:outer membrane translocation and assembly module TamA
VLEDLTNVDTLIGLGLDPITGKGKGTKAGIAADYERTATDNVANPRQGYSLSLHYEEARPGLGGTFDFRKMSAEGRGYVPLGRAVIAGRVRAGTIVAESDADAPFSERYFLGGSTSLRGWGRYQISPLQDGIAVGGRSLLESSLELRVPVRDPFGVVVFVDAGNVWSESLATRTSGLRGDAGVGVRYATPIGTVRGDIGFQLNPVEGLLVDGKEQPRPWRIHLSIGQAF